MTNLERAQIKSLLANQRFYPTDLQLCDLYILVQKFIDEVGNAEYNIGYSAGYSSGYDDCFNGEFPNSEYYES